MKEVQDHYSSKEDFNEIEKPKVETCDLILDKISSINLDEELAYKYILNVHNDNNILEILIERSSKIIYKYHETRKIIKKIKLEILGRLVVCHIMRKQLKTFNY